MAEADTQISHSDALDYWNKIPSTVNGMLGGFPHISRVDLQGSSNFLAKLRRASGSPSSGLLDCAVDCGAGIGRISVGFLSRIAAKVDLVEPVEKFTKEYEAREEVSGPGGMKELGILGDVYVAGLEDWVPSKNYDLIWNQWCLCQLADAELVLYLRRCGEKGLKSGGWIIVKENVTKSVVEEDLFDDQDSSVTRTDKNYRSLFKMAGLKIVATELQKGFPRDLYPVRMYALQPE